MLIDWVKSYRIPIYTSEVTAFPRLEIFVKHRSLYVSINQSDQLNFHNFSVFLAKWQFSQELEGYAE